MTTALAVLLILNGVFNFAVWPTFFRRVARDPRARTAEGKATPFFTVHLVIVSVALTLAAVSLVFGVLTLLGVW
ncbi:SCO4848 family membrane protein [Conyzicola sp.]|uniref:SCO4848 family membrane protein n=1 Tax=Conyzicola sp. TaxID=1969404 RepID=UPI003989E6E2